MTLTAIQPRPSSAPCVGEERRDYDRRCGEPCAGRAVRKRERMRQPEQKYPDADQPQPEDDVDPDVVVARVVEGRREGAEPADRGHQHTERGADCGAHSA